VVADASMYTVQAVRTGLHGSVPSYLQDVVFPVASVEPRRRLRSASSAELIVPAQLIDYTPA